MKNELYGEDKDWNKLSLIEKIDCLLKHLCTGACGQSHQVLLQRERIRRTLTEAKVTIGISKKPVRRIPRK